MGVVHADTNMGVVHADMNMGVVHAGMNMGILADMGWDVLISSCVTSCCMGKAGGTPVSPGSTPACVGYVSAMRVFSLITLK